MPLAQPLAHRVLARLAEAEARETDPWSRDDLRIARLTVAYAASGEAVLCSPDVLASYAVLGLHPSKVWPAILARRKALGPLCEEVSGAPPVPKKPAQAVPLWTKKTNGARAINSRAAMQYGSPRTISVPSVPMATPIAALYTNSDGPSSAKKREFAYDDLLVIVRKSFAPSSVVAATINALTARGRWPKHDGPVSRVLCVSLEGMMLGGEDGDRNVVRSTARWRARQALKHGYWRLLRKANSWSNCPKCGAERSSAKCEKCPYVGRSKTADGKANFDEFCRPFMYEIDIEKFRSAPPAKGIRHFDHRTYQDHKAAAKRGEHPNVTPIRKPAQPAPPDPPSATAAPVPKREQPAAEHSHRGTVRPEPKLAQPKLTKRETAKLVADVAELMRGHTRHIEGVGGYGYELQPDDPRYRPKMCFKSALAAVCERWKRTEEAVIEALKFWGYQLQE